MYDKPIDYYSRQENHNCLSSLDVSSKYYVTKTTKIVAHDDSVC